MTKIDLARKYLELKTEVSGATFNEELVVKYARKNTTDDLKELIKKAEVALESLKKQQKAADYFDTPEGISKKTDVENKLNVLYNESASLRSKYSDTISNEIKSYIDNPLLAIRVSLNDIIIGITDGKGGIKSLKRFDIYFSNFNGLSVELNHMSGNISLLPGNTDNDDIELIGIMSELLHNKSLIGKLIMIHNEWEAADLKLNKKIYACNDWLNNPFDKQFPVI